MKMTIDDLIALARSLANPLQSEEKTMFILEEMLANALRGEYEKKGCTVLIEKKDGGRYVVPRLKGVEDLMGEIEDRPKHGDTIIGYAVKEGTDGDA